MTKIISVRELITVLPFEKDLKSDFLERYPDKMDDLEKRVVQNIVWEVYDKYFAILFDKNLQETIQAIENGDVAIDKDLRLKALVKTEDEILDWISHSVDSQEMEKVRAQVAIT